MPILFFSPCDFLVFFIFLNSGVSQILQACNFSADQPIFLFYLFKTVPYITKKKHVTNIRCDGPFSSFFVCMSWLLRVLSNIPIVTRAQKGEINSPHCVQTCSVVGFFCLFFLITESVPPELYNFTSEFFYISNL